MRSGRNSPDSHLRRKRSLVVQRRPRVKTKATSPTKHTHVIEVVSGWRLVGRCRNDRRCLIGGGP
jgi:hypothetical protein